MQAALNTLREERRRVAEARLAVLGDDALLAADPADRRRLLDQMLIELVEIDQAVGLIGTARADTLAARVRALSSAPLKPRAEQPSSLSGLRLAPARREGLRA